MKRLSNGVTSLFYLGALLLSPLATLKAVEVQDLRCEYLKDPLGIDVVKPRLSWKIGEKSEVRSQESE